MNKYCLNYKYRIYPTKEQIEYIELCLDSVPYIYNVGIDYLNDFIMYCNVFGGFYKDELNEDIEKPTFLPSVSQVRASIPERFNRIGSKVISGVIRDNVKTAYAKRKFKDEYLEKRKVNIQGKSFHVGNGEWTYKGVVKSAIRFMSKNTIYLTNLHEMKVAVDRYFPENSFTKDAIIYKDNIGNYYLIVVVEIYNNIEYLPIIHPIGIDIDVHDLYVDNYGNRGHFIKPLKKYKEKHLKLYRKLNDKQLLSKNYNETLYKIRILYKKMESFALDQLHNIANSIVSNHFPIFIENLNIKKLMNNNKYKTIRQASKEMRFSTFINLLDYKSKIIYNHGVFKVNCIGTSKVCSNCGFINQYLELSDHIWICPICNTIHDRDINAANNILLNGLKEYGFNDGYNCIVDTRMCDIWE